MRILPFCTAMLFCYTANSYNENIESHHVQEYFAKNGSSGYVSSDEKEIQPRTPLEVYELSSYSHRRQEVKPQPQQHVPPAYNYQQSYNSQPQVQPTPTRGILTKSPSQNTSQPYVQQQYSPQPQIQTPVYEQYTQQPSAQSYERGIFGGGNNSLPVQQGSIAPHYIRDESGSRGIKDKMSTIATKMGKSNTASLFNYSKYYAINVAHPFKSSIKFSDTNSSSQTVANNGFLPLVKKNGSVGFYIGKRMQRLRALRYEYGAQWEILSFDHETSTQKYSSFLHNAGLSFRSFFDVPLSHSTFISIGLEGNYGVISKIAGDSQYFTSGFSYALLTGVTMQLSKTRSLYILLRQGAVPSKGYKVLNTTRNASFSSTSIMIGMQLLSM